RNLTGHNRAVSSLSAGGGRLFSASEDGTVRSWVVATGECSRVLTGHEGYVTAVCMTAEGRLFSAGADRLINEWDPSTGRRLWMLQGHTRIILALASGAGKLYSAGNDHTIRVWEMSTGKCVAVLEEHSDWVFSLAVYIPPPNMPRNAQGPTAPVLFSSSKDGSVKVWDVEGAKCVRTLVGHDRLPVRAVAVADGGRLFSAGDDKGIVEWDVPRGKAVRTLAGHQAAVSSLVVTPNGLMYSGSGDTTIRIWD
ncbi:WD40-repeat-containing domain protein, partial [Cladochytrium replicatum]